MKNYTCLFLCVLLKANDLCLVKLTTAITDVEPVSLYARDAEEINSQVWFCGFGDYSSLAGQSPNVLSNKHAIENTLDRKNTGITTIIDSLTYEGGLLAFDFDSPSETINSLGDETINADETLLGTGTSSATALELEGTTVEGDSGGPLFVQDGAGWKLAGVLSGGALEPISNHEDGSYGDISIFIRVSQQIDWIEAVIR